jgi:formate-dependent nitrite reductase membrane component NrfD
MPEITLTGINALTYPFLKTWGWEVAIYLFIGGLVGGLMVFDGALRLRRPGQFPTVPLWSDVVGFPLLALGMLLLLLDLSNRWNTWRFFTTFQVTSAISWGAWLLLATMPVLALKFLSRLPALPHFPERQLPPKPRWRRWITLLATGFLRLVWYAGGLLTAIGKKARQWDHVLAIACVPLGIGLGLYTGTFLSTIAARPLWNNAVVPPLFWLSGLGASGAFLCLLLPKEESKSLTFYSVLICGFELLLIMALVVNMIFGTLATQRAISYLLEGILGLAFWGLVVVFGLIVPAALEALELAHRRLAATNNGSWQRFLQRIPTPGALPPVLKLAGGIALRFVIVYAGMRSFV